MLIMFTTLFLKLLESFAEQKFYTDTWAMFKSNHMLNPLMMSASKDFCIHKVEAMVWWHRNFCYTTNILLACIKQQLSVFPVFNVVKKEIWKINALFWCQTLILYRLV